MILLSVFSLKIYGNAYFGKNPLDSIYGLIYKIHFDDEPYNHNMHIASDGKFYYTVNGGNVDYGKINKYDLNGNFIRTCKIGIDFRSIMYNKADGFFYACGFEKDWTERNIYKITSIENGTFERIFTNLYDYPQSSTALSQDGQFLYAFYAGTLKKYNFSDGSLVDSLVGLNYGEGNFGGDGAVAVDNDFIYTWNSDIRDVYVYDFLGNLLQNFTLDYGDNGHSLSIINGMLFVSSDGNYSTGTWYGYYIQKVTDNSQGSPINAGKE